MTRLLDTREAAAILGKSTTWLEHARIEGRGPHFVKIGRAVRYHPSDVDAFIEKHRVKTTMHE